MNKEPQEKRLCPTLLGYEKIHFCSGRTSAHSEFQFVCIHSHVHQPISYAAHDRQLLFNSECLVMAQPAPFPDNDCRGITTKRGPQWNAIPPHLYQDFSTGLFKVRSVEISERKSRRGNFRLADLKDIDQAFDEETSREIDVPSEDVYIEPSI